jgi:hypothetical protein
VPVALAVAVGLGVPVPLGVGVAVGVGLIPGGAGRGAGVGRGLGVGVDLGAAVAVAVAVPVAVEVGVAVAVAVAVGVGVPPPMVPLIRYIWSGPLAVGMHVNFAVHVGQTPNPPPGFCQAAGELDSTVRSVQPHSPCVAKSMLGWISIQYVPAVSTAAGFRFTVKVVPLTDTG